MPPRLRRAVLTLHIITSVGWLGSVIGYIALDLTAATSRDEELARAAYAAMDVTVTSAIVPLALASVGIGVINALGTSWGLFRHWWVIVKLFLTLVATAVLLIETRTIRALAQAAGSGADPRDLPSTLGHSIGGLVILVLVTMLSIYKPRGLTRYGWRRQKAERSQRVGEPATSPP